jgi:hypothetical protein
MNTRPNSIAEAFKLCLRFEGEEWTCGRLRERVESFAAAPGTVLEVRRELMEE